ncbi:MAG TPA: amino acid adenylation domain-containing protein [Pyrinomonadaceae bacterium]|nr:amino acid adenylation domain-containing protein [Pyrinomonadaceae bacterium]
MSEGIRLSPQQKHLWALTTSDGPLPYAARSAIRLDGRLDKAALGRAVKCVVGRHEILRTVFRLFPGMSVPVQVITDAAATPADEISLTGLDERSQERELERLFQSISPRPFVSESPALGATLVSLSATRHVLLLALPAACADALTLANLTRELARAYESCLRGGEPSESPLQYPDVSEVFNELLESEETEAGRDYWKRQDLSALADLRLPFERQSSDAHSFAPAVFTSRLAPDLVEKIHDAALEHAASESSVLLACWQLLLGRLTGQTEVVVGTTYDGRAYEGLADALGLFARCLPVRCRVEAGHTFAELVAQAERNASEIYEWQDYFDPSRDAGARNGDAGPRTLPYCFEFEEQPQPIAAGGVVFSAHRRDVCFHRYGVKLCCVSAGDGITTELHYDRALYTAGHVEALTRQFDALLRSALDAPLESVAGLELLTEEERRRILVDLNQTAAEYPRGLCVQQLFEAQAARTPDAPAVSFDDESLTYGALNSKANRLAHHLRASGVGAESRVGLYLERGLDAIVALLAVIKAGGAYVPLDLTLPPARLSLIIREAGLSAVLTHSALLKSLPDEPVRVVSLDADAELIAATSDANPPCRTSPENLAYVIYTSGSTGRPKGVMVEHRSVVNLSFALRDEVYRGMDGPLAVGLNAPLTFDASVKQLIQLLHGHQLHVLPEEVRADPARFVAFARRHALSVFDCTPFQLKTLLASGLDEATGEGPKMILVGGEALDDSTWHTLARSERVNYFNLYGPTECTVDAAACRVQSAPDEATIGRPIPNAEIYILDDDLKPVPVGVAGELHIGGTGLARGYLSQPSLSAERFIPNPFGGARGARLYKTGDVARYLPDGRIKFLGRNDFQIKLRGYRIELKEIEAVALEHASVAEAVVVGRSVADGAGAELVAYVVPKESAAPTRAPDAERTDLRIELREFLRSRLPEYMIPAAVVVLSALPVSAHGKIDRARLPDPQREASSFGMKYEAPRNQVERAVATIWQEELQLERVGIHDNFFDLGGSSLVMARVFDRLQTNTERKLRLVEMFRHTTVSTLAEYLSGEQAEEFRPESVDRQVGRQKAALERQRRSQRRGQKVEPNGHSN